MTRLAVVLPDFSPNAAKAAKAAAAAAALVGGGRSPSAGLPEADAPASPEVDLPAVIAQAEARGRAAAQAEADAALAQMLAAQEAALAAEIAAARGRWTEEQAERLAGALQAGLAALEAGLRDAIAPLITRFVKRGVERRALDDLAALVGPILAREDRPVLKVSGPADLVGRLRTQLGDPPACLFEVADVPDIEVVCGETRLETQIAAWIQRLDGDED